MIIPVYRSRKKAKTRFFAAYAFSVLLILVLFSSFLKPTASIVKKFEPFVNGKADHHSTIYQELHQRMEKLDNVCVKVAANRSADNLALLMAEERAFYGSIDSVRKSFVSLPDAKKEKELVALLEAFTRAAEKQISLARGTTASTETSGQSGLFQEQLLEKDQRLAELENQNRLLLSENQKMKDALQNSTSPSPAVTPPVATDNSGEWKTRYEAMRTAHDRLKETNTKYESQINSLKKTYQDVVDDNRRLLAQLQAARAGRN
jgi:hypothetical protein